MNKSYSIDYQNPHIILKPLGPHKRSVIFMHGLGDSASGWYDIFLEEKLNLEDAKIILLTAPIAPVGINGGMQMTSWFDISQDENNVYHHSIDEARKNVKFVQGYIDKEIEHFKGNASNVFVGGFSQGGAMSLLIGLENEKELGGVFALSGFCFAETQIKQPNLRMLVTHGDEDQMIKFKEADASYEKIKSLKNFSFTKISNLGHSVNHKVFTLLAKFFK